MAISASTPGGDYVKTGRAVAIEPDAKFKNGFNAQVRTRVTCSSTIPALATTFWAATTQPICDSLLRMDADRDAVPDDTAALKEALATERAKAFEIAAELARRRRKTVR